MMVLCFKKLVWEDVMIALNSFLYDLMVADRCTSKKDPQMKLLLTRKEEERKKEDEFCVGGI